MGSVLSEEEMNALLELFRADDAGSQEQQGAKESLVERDLQRRFFRSCQDLPAILHVGDKTHRVTATNISLGGVFVCASPPVAIGEEVGVALELSEPAARIDVRGCVCWHKESDAELLGLGIRFRSLSIEAIWAIIANIEQARKKTF